jgi:hypothetical protein
MSEIAIEDILVEISGALSDILVAIEKPSDDKEMAASLLIGLRELVDAKQAKPPEVNVTVQPTPITIEPTPITVQPSSVIISEPQDNQIKNWKLVVSSRDGNGYIREVTLKAE